MQHTPPDRFTRTRWCIDGLSVGDAFGDRFFFEQRATQTDIGTLPATARTLPSGYWNYTDDTQMALSVVEVLFRHATIVQDALARSFAEHFERWRGYGSAMYDLLPRLRAGHHWQDLAHRLFGGSGSFGNGAAMRVPPVGAFFAEDLATVIEQAQLSAEVTHTHPEAIAGAVAVAVATALAWQQREVTTPLRGAAFLDAVVSHIPATTVRERVVQAARLAPETSVLDATKLLGNGSAVSAQDTVPFALWCAARSLDSYEEAIWLTASGLGDIDTNCAIVGGIVATFTGSEGIPAEWLQRREHLPDWAFQHR